MTRNNYCHEFNSFLIQEFIPLGYKITKSVELDSVPENSKYEALIFSLNNSQMVYRKGKVTTDRPGAFLSVWQRPPLESNNGNKPIPLSANDFDYLFVQVENLSNLTKDLGHNPKYGMFIFPVSILIEKGIFSSSKNKGKTGFRVFPPWSEDRGVTGAKVFSESGKKTQQWQLPYFLGISTDGSIDSSGLLKILNHKNT